MISAVMFAVNTGPLLAADSEQALPRVLGSPNGRYVFGQISDFRADQFLLDTQTGRLWQIVLIDTHKFLQPILFDVVGDSRASLTPPENEGMITLTSEEETPENTGLGPRR